MGTHPIFESDFDCPTDATMSRSMQNLLREFRTLYEERLQRLENAPLNEHNLKAKNEVYQHYVHDLLEQNDALINALKDSEHKLDTSMEAEHTLLEEVHVAKGAEEALARVQDAKSSVERELQLAEARGASFQEQLEASDAARKRLEETINEAHHDLARCRSDMKDLREKVARFETNSETIDQGVIRLKVQLEEGQGEVSRLTGLIDHLEKSLETTKAEQGACDARERRLQVQLAERDADLAQLEADLGSARLGRDTVVSKETDNKQQKAMMAAKISELEKELKRKVKETQDDRNSLERRKSTLTIELQKLRELLNEAHADRTAIKEASKRAEMDQTKAVSNVNNEKTQLELRLERRSREVEDLAAKVADLNGTLSVMRQQERAARHDCKELEGKLVHFKRESSQLETAMEASNDRRQEIKEVLHQRDVELDAIKSIMTNKSAEFEELQMQLSKQEQLVHELTTELTTKTGELRRLALSFDDTSKELDAQMEHARLAKHAYDVADEQLGRVKAELEHYEKMKPHPEAEVIALQAKIDCLVMERDSARVKGQDAARRLSELGALCGELRGKLKQQTNHSEKRQRTATVYETKCLAAERRIKEVEHALETQRGDDQREIERYRTQVALLERRAQEQEQGRRNAEELLQRAQDDALTWRSSLDVQRQDSGDKSERIVKLEHEASLARTELDNLVVRIKDTHLDNVKMEKIIEDLTANCETLQRYKRESESLLKALRGELGMATKARKATEKQVESYRNTIRQLEDDVQTKTHQFERLNDQLLQRGSSEATLRSKKKDLKQSLNQLTEDKHKIGNEKLDLERDNQELTRCGKTLEDALKALRREFDLVRQKTKRDSEHLKKTYEISETELQRRNRELEAKLTRLQGECVRLNDVIEKTGVELNASKVHLSQLQRAEHHAMKAVETARLSSETKDKYGKEQQIEIERFKAQVAQLTGELHRRMCEKEALSSEEEKLRKYSMKQQTLIHELRRKLAMFSSDLKKSDFKVAYQPQAYGDFAATQ